ncbi:MAG TPA: hypothetical protein DCE41_02390 [Cytophagales bacterium]|nr:hypothetical protein [Cytophagales bacterium]HAA23937.1 hypothetical protein [Cytophagales bacterium]HAP59391.1 hypothetical protein [Cytophagales bacterium]
MYWANRLLRLDVALNAGRWVVGPKVSGSFCYQMLVLGSELVAYTDFERTTLRWLPLLGIGARLAS